MTMLTPKKDSGNTSVPPTANQSAKPATEKTVVPEENDDLPF